MYVDTNLLSYHFYTDNPVQIKGKLIDCRGSLVIYSSMAVDKILCDFAY